MISNETIYYMNLSEPMESNDDKTIDLLVHKSKLIKNI